MECLNTYLDLEYCKILRSGFDFKSNLTSVIGNLANRSFLESYVSHHKAMAYNSRQQWMPLWPPLSTAGEQFNKNTSTSRIQLTTLLFYRFIPNLGKAPSHNPFGRGYLRWIRRVHSSHVIGGANSTTMVVMFVDCCVGGGRYIWYYSHRRNSTGQEFFIPPGTLIALNLLAESLF